jgi:hypothetical protein
MGPIDAVLFFVVAGSNLQWLATAAAAGPSSLVVWLIGCLAMFVPLSVVVVFLSSHYPDEGGLYVWSKRAFGLGRLHHGLDVLGQQSPLFPRCFTLLRETRFSSQDHAAECSGPLRSTSSQ